jgi:hypothetical protein
MPKRAPVQERLFQPPPASYTDLQVAVAVNLDGPHGSAQCWVTITDLSTRERVACWSVPANRLADAPTCASEIIADAVRTAMVDLSPF